MFNISIKASKYKPYSPLQVAYKDKGLMNIQSLKFVGIFKHSN